jgi:hypothetical protein
MFFSGKKFVTSIMTRSLNRGRMRKTTSFSSHSTNPVDQSRSKKQPADDIYLFLSAAVEIIFLTSKKINPLQIHISENGITRKKIDANNKFIWIY